MFPWRNRLLRNRFIRHLPFAALGLWLLVLAWFVLCFLLSSQTGEETNQLSTAMARMISEWLGFSVESIPTLNRGLRTLAHFVCFFVLSGLVCGACAATFSSHVHFLWGLAPCILFAFWDEIRKVNIVGRHCSIPEAFLNTVGCVLGCMALGAILKVLCRSD